MSSITIKPYASIKGSGGANGETVGAIVTFSVKKGITPGVDFTVSYDNSPLTLDTTTSTDKWFGVDFGNNIPFKNNAAVQHTLPITIDRTVVNTSGTSFSPGTSGNGLETSGYIFARASSNAILIPTSSISIEDCTPNVSGYKISTTATIYTGIFTSSGDTTLQNKFFANPSGLDANKLNVNLTLGTTLSESSKYTNRFDNTSLKSSDTDATAGATYVMYSIVLPPETVANNKELKFEDGSDPTKALNKTAVSFRLLSTVLQSIKITCGAPTLVDSTDGQNNQYINNNSSTLYCFATRYIQYNTQDTLFGDNQISIEPGDDTVILPSRALFNTGSTTTGYSAGQAYTNGYLSPTDKTGSVVLKNGTETGEISNLKEKIEGSSNALTYADASKHSTYTDASGQTQWYATCIYKSSSAKTLKDSTILSAQSTFCGTFSNSIVNNTSGDYDGKCLAKTNSGASQTFTTSGIGITATYNAAHEGTIPNISGWVNECIYLF